MKNQDVRERAKQKGIKLWQIAECLNINDGNFSRRLRKELTADEKKTIFKIIDSIGGEK